VRARPRPARLVTALPVPEQQIFTQAGVDPAQLQAYLTQHNLALLVTRNVTTRDDFDHQQPLNLRVPGGVQTMASDFVAGDTVYDVTHLQIFQADQLRGWTGCCSTTPQPGRRVLAQVLHDAAALANNPANPGGPAGSVQVAVDGSAAAFVPARRALAWQLTDATGAGVVRERNWITFQPGEMRVCSSCHGLSDLDQAGQLAPANQPQALLTLLNYWKANACQGDNCQVPTATPTATSGASPTVTPTPTLIQTPPAPLTSRAYLPHVSR
jgi:hypothetical protein